MVARDTLALFNHRMERGAAAEGGHRGVRPAGAALARDAVEPGGKRHGSRGCPAQWSVTTCD